MENCLKQGKGCEFICTDFRFGTSGSLFLGDLEEIQEVIVRM